MVNIAAVAAFAPEMASRLMRLLPREFQDAALAGFGLSVWRHLKAGAVHAHLLRRTA